jgi:hypothetical protein
MHREIMNAPRGRIVDHANGDSLDNRDENLRVTTQSGNLANRRKVRGKSRYKGVWWNIQKRRWIADIVKDGHKYVLGRFSSESLAAFAYDAAARQLFGGFAALNFPSVGEKGCQHNPAHQD